MTGRVQKWLDQNYHTFADVAQPITQPAESTLGKGIDYIIALLAPQQSQPQSSGVSVCFSERKEKGYTETESKLL